jgi:hypothetical protein
MQRREYPCGCSAAGSLPLPAYCPEHDVRKEPINKPENYSVHTSVSDYLPPRDAATRTPPYHPGARMATLTTGPSDACGAAVEEIDYSKFALPLDSVNFGALPAPLEEPLYLPLRDVKNPNPKDAIATNKLPLHLVSPFVKAYQSIAHFLGNVKYGAWNYRGTPVRASVYIAALLRHVDAWQEGQEDDPTDGTPHLANAMACIGILIDAKHNKSLIDDRQIQNHFEEYAAMRVRFEALMVKIRAQYGDSNPRHFTREQV